MGLYVGTKEIMALTERKPSGREQDQAQIDRLDRLRYKLHGKDLSKARRAAYKLSWQQEDGLEILEEAMLGRTGKMTKVAAGYGLRKMNGRMRKMAMDVITKGLNSSSDNTKQICKQTLILLLLGPKGKGASSADISAQLSGLRIEDISTSGNAKKKKITRRPVRISGNRKY
jgi:hypothetical protein